jgi:hypothetical protein
MQRRKLIFIVFVLSFALNADTLILRNGSTIEGTFLGASVRQIDFLTTSGKTIHEQIGNIKGIDFAAAPNPSQQAAPAAAAPAAARASVTIPAGTALRVRTLDNIDADTSKSGMQFRATLDDPLMSGGAVVVPRGAPVVLVAANVQQGGSMKGADAISLKVNSISVNGKAYQIVTSLAESKAAGEGKKTARRTIGGAGLGAAIGGLAGGGSGAGIGALVGGAVGVAASAGGSHLKIPPETRLEFKLQSDWKIQ